MPEHQQIQQSTESKTTFQKRVAPIIQTSISNPMAIIQRARINPKSLTHADVMQLQRTIGNRAVGRLLSEIRSSPMAQQAPVQRQEIPEEETCPSCVQRQETPEEEENPLQGVFESKFEQTACPSCIQRKELEEEEPLQTKRENNTGMPDNLKAGVESLSEIDMSDVRVHYNSDKPAQVGALAYTQGTNIHVAPGQEKHLPHEAWHVVQQTQGRVRPTMQLKDGVPVNDDEELEHEADVMGVKTLGSVVQWQQKPALNTSSLGTYKVIQTFKPTKAQEILIREHRTNEKIKNNGWVGKKVDELVDWCKSERQYNSFINNLSYTHWEILSKDFKAEELPRKVLDAWVTYQNVNREVEKLSHFTGWKASKGEIWNNGTEESDWSGCYIATKKEQAEGYIEEAGGMRGKASLWELSSTRDIPTLSVKGGFIDQSDIKEEFKALVLKKVLNINVDEKLLPYLGREQMAYMGPAGEAGEELVMPWGLVDVYLKKKRIKEYDVQSYVITGSHDL